VLASVSGFLCSAGASGPRLSDGRSGGDAGSGPSFGKSAAPAMARAAMATAMRRGVAMIVLWLEISAEKRPAGNLVAGAPVSVPRPAMAKSPPWDWRAFRDCVDIPTHDR